MKNDMEGELARRKVQFEREQEKNRNRDARLEELRQRRNALMEEVDGIDEEVERVEDPSGKEKDRVLLCGPEVSGAWLYTQVALCG
jgi:hypothetical protein